MSTNINKNSLLTVILAANNEQNNKRERKPNFNTAKEGSIEAAQEEVAQEETAKKCKTVEGKYPKAPGKPNNVSLVKT